MEALQGFGIKKGTFVNAEVMEEVVAPEAKPSVQLLDYLVCKKSVILNVFLSKS